MVEDISALLQASERQLGVSLTVVDYHGLFHDEHNRPVIGQDWQSHKTCKACAIGFGPECVAHCRWQVGERLVKRAEPFVTRCWKGIREIACPLQWNGCHLGTLFAGTWRQASLPARANQFPASWRSSWQTAWEQLPIYDEHAEQDLKAVVALVATGLAEQLTTTALRPSAGDSLKTSIAHFVRLHCHLPIGLSDLAEHLGRSQSRTGAIVREQFDSTFAQLLLHYRLKAAKNLLRFSHLKIADVAKSVGFNDALYFSRKFTAEQMRVVKVPRPGVNFVVIDLIVKYLGDRHSDSCQNAGEMPR